MRMISTMFVFVLVLILVLLPSQSQGIGMQMSDSEIEHWLELEDVQDNVDDLRELDAPEYFVERMMHPVDPETPGTMSVANVFPYKHLPEEEVEGLIEKWTLLFDTAKFACKIFSASEDRLGLFMVADRGMIDMSLAMKFALEQPEIEHVELDNQAYFKDGSVRPVQHEEL